MIWIKLNYKNYFIQVLNSSLEIELLISNYSINYVENKFFITLHFPNKKNFTITSISKNNNRIVSVTYHHQIYQVNLKKNIILICTTRGRIDMLKLDNLHQLFFFDCLTLNNPFLRYNYSSFFKKTFKCSGLLCYSV